MKMCTSTWLPEKYLDSFRCGDKMNLAIFARIVHMEWKLTPSRSKLVRARRFAMKKIYGDESKHYNMFEDYGNEVMRSSNLSITFFQRDQIHFYIYVE